MPLSTLLLLATRWTPLVSSVCKGGKWAQNSFDIGDDQIRTIVECLKQQSPVPGGGGFSLDGSYTTIVNVNADFMMMKNCQATYLFAACE